MSFQISDNIIKIFLSTMNDTKYTKLHWHLKYIFDFRHKKNQEKSFRGCIYRLSISFHSKNISPFTEIPENIFLFTIVGIFKCALWSFYARQFSDLIFGEKIFVC